MLSSPLQILHQRNCILMSDKRNLFKGNNDQNREIIIIIIIIKIREIIIKKATMIGSDVEPLKKSAVTPARFLFKNGSLSASVSVSA